MIERSVLAVLAAVAALVLSLPPTAGAITARTTLPDVEDEVMCVECGTVLNISNSAVADDQRDFIQERIERGATKEEIKRDLVQEFGPDVLAMPDGRGFNAAVYVIPAVLGLLGLLGVALAARRWRSAPRASPVPDSGGPELDPAEEQRLAAELAAFDR